MQFLFFAAQYLPTVGGVERYTYNLAKTLTAMGHGATVATSALPGLPAREVDENGIEVFRLPAFLPMNGRFPVPKPGAAFDRLAAELWKKPFGFAVINTRFYPLSLWAAHACDARGIPALVLEHGTKHLSLDSALLDGVGNLYEHTAMKLVRRWCDDFYGVSKACGDWLAHFHVAAKGTLYNAVDTGELEATAATARRDFRAEAGAAPDAPLIAFIGRFIVEKGVRELLEAFAAFRAARPGAALVMAGDGPLLAEVRAAAPAGVLLTGALPYTESLALMRQADVFCLPTYSEGFSTTILEAAALGACIVTTPTGGSPELIQNGESGILLEGHDPKSIEDALLHCAESPALRAEMGQKARAAVQARFTWQRTAESLLAVAETAQP
ncbi:glycosyltransferase family 4 protein [Ruminococcaceae bacterium OttesenSCG-928-A11]|nr:glycosyltransferase family 4 protein [Ruminococcaceae bacterium OttesenSCG-928-A11]